MPLVVPPMTRIPVSASFLSEQDWKSDVIKRRAMIKYEIFFIIKDALCNFINNNSAQFTIFSDYEKIINQNLKI
jgi:hypothetical protein